MIRRVWIISSKTWLRNSCLLRWTMFMAIMLAIAHTSTCYSLSRNRKSSMISRKNRTYEDSYPKFRHYIKGDARHGKYHRSSMLERRLHNASASNRTNLGSNETLSSQVERKSLHRTSFTPRKKNIFNSNVLAPSWVIKFSDDHIHHNLSTLHLKAILLASQIGDNFRYHGPVGALKGHYLIVHDSFLDNSFTGNSSKIVEAKITQFLRQRPEVEWVMQEKVRMRFKRTLQFKDQFFPSQWHLDNLKFVGHDINVTGVWEHNITGKGVVVSVIDDGVEWTNPDILDNYSAEGSWDLNSNDADPMPRVDEAGLNHHGTRCAGEIAAVANEYCAVGVAYGARVSGVRILDGPMTDSLEAMAFNTKMNVNDVFSCSWGPDDNGKTVDGPHQLAQAALAHGVMAGRKGYGGIYVVASGNGGHFKDNCNFDGYANSIFTVTIGAVDELGQMPYYAEQCAAMLAVTYSSGQGHQRNIVTTDWRLGTGSGCTDRHTGTSAAAPLAAGIIALMLEVRPCLTWRDVQHIIVYTAVKVNIDEEEWHRNGAGFPHSHKHGFGLLNTWRLVTTAKIWPGVPYLTSWSSPLIKVHAQIPFGSRPLIKEFFVSGSMATDVSTLEHVTVTVNVNHRCRGTLTVQLLSPGGTKSKLATPRRYDRSTEGFVDWTFSTVRCWGERPQGTWKLIIIDTANEQFGGMLKDWRLTFYGSSITPRQIQERKRIVQNAWSGKFMHAPGPPCQPPPSPIPTKDIFSARMVKVLLLLSGFFTMIGVYMILETVFRDICSKQTTSTKEKENLSPDLIDVQSLIPAVLTEQDQARLHMLIEQGDQITTGSTVQLQNKALETTPVLSVPVTPDEITRLTEFENRLNFALEQSVALQAKQMHEIQDLEKHLFEISASEGLGPADIILEGGKAKIPKKTKLKGILKKPKQYKD